MTLLDSLAVPIVLAPMAGGPSTPQLVDAVGRGGGLGFLAGGYLSSDRLRADLEATRALSDVPFGVNLFVVDGRAGDAAAIAAYATELAPLAEQAGVELGVPRFDDDDLPAKLALLITDAPAVVSFTFGLPTEATVGALHEAGSEVWLTVTSPAEARQAAELEPDALIVQGVEAGGHRGVFVDDGDQSDLSLLPALQLIAAETDLPLIGAGSIMTGDGLAGVLCAGASAAQLGTVYLNSDEAGTSAPHRSAVTAPTRTVLTRVFSGRTARGITNAWHEQFAEIAPAAYPEIHHLTSPLRAAGRQAGDPNRINLWAGQAHQLAPSGSAEIITRRLAEDAKRSLDATRGRFRNGSPMPDHQAPGGSTLSDLAGEEFVSLATYRRSGVAVSVPVWIAPSADDPGVLLVTTTARSGKVKRLRNDPRVELTPCDRRGEVAAGAPRISASAEVIDDPAVVRRLREAIRVKYGERMKVTAADQGVDDPEEPARAILRITAPR